MAAYIARNAWLTGPPDQIETSKSKTFKPTCHFGIILNQVLRLRWVRKGEPGEYKIYRRSEKVKKKLVKLPGSYLGESPSESPKLDKREKQPK